MARQNVPGIPGACATHNFTYLVRGPWNIQCVLWNIHIVLLWFVLLCYIIRSYRIHMMPSPIFPCVFSLTPRRYYGHNEVFNWHIKIKRCLWKMWISNYKIVLTIWVYLDRQNIRNNEQLKNNPHYMFMPFVINNKHFRKRNMFQQQRFYNQYTGLELLHAVLGISAIKMYSRKI